MLSEAIRVLKPGGYLMIDTPNFDITERIEKIIQKNNPGWKHGIEVGHVHEFRYQELRDLLLYFNLKIIKETGVYLPIDTLILNRWINPAWQYRTYQRVSMYLGRRLPRYAYLMSFFTEKGSG